MVDPIPERIKKVWEHWNIRGVILLSLFLQIFLIFFAPLRKGTQRFLFMFTIWSAYLLADYFANYCVGLISNSQLDSIKSSKSAKTYINTNSDLLACWAPFLLLHLGGPDTITALAMEDNELWLRHLLGFISQVAAAAYVFMLSMPGNTLWLPTLLVFLAGVIKYGERTYSLYCGSIDAFREYGEPNTGLNYPLLMETYHSWREAGIPAQFVEIPNRHEISNETTANDTTDKENRMAISHEEAVQKAFYFFNKFKGLIVDMIFSLEDREESRKYFNGLSNDDALTVIEIELNFLYEAFYTKFLVVHNVYGFILRFVATITIASALVIFYSLDKDKYDFDGFDVRVTYALLCGAVGLDFVALFMLISSDRTLVFLINIPQVQLWLQNKAPQWVRSWLKRKNKAPKWKPYNNKPYEGFNELSTTIFFRRWNGSMSGFNLIKHCLDQCSKKKNILNCCCHFVKRPYLKYFGYSRNPFFEEVWKHIIAELKEKSAWATDANKIHMICDARGEWVISLIRKELTTILTETEKEKIKSLLSFVDANEVPFDQSLILWHIATHLCCSWADQNPTGEHQDQDQTQPEKNQSQDQNQSQQRLISKLIADYMMYLLIFQSKLLSTVAGIGIKGFQDTCEEATKFFERRELHAAEKTDSQTPRKSLEKDKEMERKACNLLGEVDTDIKASDIKGNESNACLFDACRLAKDLMELKKDLRWRIISKVWVEMLSFAATNCRPTAHVHQYSKGGELISLVWLLMVRFGIGKQFQITSEANVINPSYAFLQKKKTDLKLIVGTSD